MKKKVEMSRRRKENEGREGERKEDMFFEEIFLYVGNIDIDVLKIEYISEL